MNPFKNLQVKATGIGSMPHKDISYICGFILDNFPDLPFWPQLSRVDPHENMLIQYSENIPCIFADLEKKGAYFDMSGDNQQQLLEFYEKFTEGDFEYFRMSPEYAAGFYQMLKQIDVKKAGILKGQVVGPLTFLASVQDKEGKLLLYNEELSDAVTKALAMKAVWQAKQIIQVNKTPVIFFDEPYLASFGSAFCNLSKEKVISVINDVVEVVKTYVNISVGVHCCGNTDWPMMLETKMDIINFDFYGFGKYFILYPEAIKKFIDKGGMIAWGVVPTTEFDSTCTQRVLLDKFQVALKELEKKGLNKQNILDHSLFTPSCGMGTLDKSLADEIVKITAEFAKMKI